MAYDEMDGPQGPAASEADILRQLRGTFEKMPNDIDLYLFSNKAGDDMFTQAARSGRL